MGENNFSISLINSGFLSMLSTLFIALKLLNKIDWSWWWVLAPIWIPLATILLVLIVVIIVLSAQEDN